MILALLVWGCGGGASAPSMNLQAGDVVVEAGEQLWVWRGGEVAVLWEPAKTADLHGFGELGSAVLGCSRVSASGWRSVLISESSLGCVIRPDGMSAVHFRVDEGEAHAQLWSPTDPVARDLGASVEATYIGTGSFVAVMRPTGAIAVYDLQANLVSEGVGAPGRASLVSLRGASGLAWLEGGGLWRANAKGQGAQAVALSVAPAQLASAGAALYVLGVDGSAWRVNSGRAEALDAPVTLQRVLSGEREALWVGPGQACAGGPCALWRWAEGGWVGPLELPAPVQHAVVLP